MPQPKIKQLLSDPYKKFKDLSVGGCFISDSKPDKLLQKESEVWAHCLLTSIPYKFEGDDLVEPVEVEISWKRLKGN